MCCSALQCVAVYCSLLQCVAVCCSVSQWGEPESNATGLAAAAGGVFPPPPPCFVSNSLPARA